MKTTVVIATYNRAASALRQIEELRPQAAATGARIVVVDNGTDGAAQALAAQAGSLALTVLQTHRGKNLALNRALDTVEGDLILFADDDVEFVPGWIEAFIQAAGRWPGHGVFAGPIVPAFPCDVPDFLIDHPFQRIAYGRFLFDAGEGPIPGVSPFGANFAVRRDVIGRQRFDEGIAADVDRRGAPPLCDETAFLREMRARSGDMVYVPSAGVRHPVEPHQLDERWLFDRSFRVGRAEAILDPDRAAARLAGVPRYLWRQLVEAYLSYWRARRAASPVTRFDTGLRLNYVRGQIFQYRRGATVNGPR